MTDEAMATSEHEENAQEMETLTKPSKLLGAKDSCSSKQRKYTTIKVERYFRLILWALFSIGIFVIFFISEHQHLSSYRILSFSIFLTHFIWLISFLCIILTIDNIHLIKVQRKIIPNTKLLIIPFAYYEYDEFPIKSISNMSSMRGSNLFHILSTTMSISFGMVFSAVTIKWSEHRFKHNPLTITALILLLLSSHGGGVLSRWELSESKMSIFIHNLGAFLAFVAGPLSFLLYQRFSALSIILTVVTFIGLMIFSYLQNCVKPTKKKIHTFSLLCIFVELLTCLCGMLTVILFVYCMDGDIIL